MKELCHLTRTCLGHSSQTTKWRQPKFDHCSKKTCAKALCEVHPWRRPRIVLTTTSLCPVYAQSLLEKNPAHTCELAKSYILAPKPPPPLQRPGQPTCATHGADFTATPACTLKPCRPVPEPSTSNVIRIALVNKFLAHREPPTQRPSMQKTLNLVGYGKQP